MPVTISQDRIPDTATCPICNEDGAKRVFFSRDRVHKIPGIFGLFKCGACDALFIQPWLSSQELAGYYPKDYHPFRRSRSLGKKNYGGWRRFVLENHYGYPPLRKQSPSAVTRAVAFGLSRVTTKGVIRYRGAGKILDVGCGGGSYLYRLRQWGWDAYGVEPSESGVTQARSLGLNVRQGMLADARFPDAFFDVVRLNHVLEHLIEPRETFREINRILKPDGYVRVTAPNTRSLGFWMFQENWYALDSPRHVISYCPRTLRILCDATGFQIAEMNFSAGPFISVRSMQYLMEARGEDFPRWMRQIEWQRSKLIRRTLKPFFYFVDSLGFGDVINATLRK